MILDNVQPGEILFWTSRMDLVLLIADGQVILEKEILSLQLIARLRTGCSEESVTCIIILATP